MKAVFYFLFVLFVFYGTPFGVWGQGERWRHLIALESKRDDVENLLGEPDMYFETFGSYENQEGRFFVWYSKGGCHKDVKGLQYNVAGRKLTRIFVYPKRSLPLSYYVTGKDNYRKTESLMTKGRYLYTSPDESVVYETIVPNSKEDEFVYTVSIQPSKNKEHLLCKEYVKQK